MKKKWGVFSIFFILVGICLLFHPWKFLYSKHHVKEHYVAEAPATFSHNKTPYVQVEIEGKTILAKVDLASSSILALPKSFLNELNQKPYYRNICRFGIHGKRYHCDEYEIPKARIDEMSFSQIPTEEIKPEFVEHADFDKSDQEQTADEIGVIGWRLFYNLNVLLDFENEKIVFCDSLKTLRKQGYPVDSFIETPMLSDRNSIEFRAKTQNGSFLCVLDTVGTLNIVNEDLENEYNKGHMIIKSGNDQHKVLNPNNSDQKPEGDTYTASVFKIGKKDFGNTTFKKMKMPYQIDAIVGMDFLKSKLVFLDFPNRKIYFYEKKDKNNDVNKRADNDKDK